MTALHACTGSWGFPALRHLTPANWRTLACIHRGARPFEKPRHMFGFLGPCSCLAGVLGDEFASGRGGSMVSGRGADLDRDAESAVHGRTQGVASLLRRRPSLAASEGEPLSSSAESFRRAAGTPRRGQRGHIRGLDWTLSGESDGTIGMLNVHDFARLDISFWAADVLRTWPVGPRLWPGTRQRRAHGRRQQGFPKGGPETFRGVTICPLPR